MPYEEGYLRRHYNHLEKETGRRYALGDLYGPGGASKGNPKYEFMGIKRYWRYSEDKMHSLTEEGVDCHAEKREGTDA